MKKQKSVVRQLLCILAGNFLVALAVSFFVLPNDLLTGGVACLAIDLAPFVPLSRVTLIYIINFSMFFLGWIFLGKKFALNTALSTALYPILISVFEAMDTRPFASVDPLLGSLYAGLIMGCGLGIIFSVNASTGGMDIPALILNKFAHIPVNNAVMIVDGLTILFGLYSYGINAALTGLISVFASNTAINWISTLNSASAKEVLIISEHWKEIKDYILQNTNRGVTILEGSGGYTQNKRPVLLCAMTSRQYPRIAEEITEIDPKAFLVVSDAREVRGEGFTYPSEDEG